jgi:hypothetical protein
MKKFPLVNRLKLTVLHIMYFAEERGKLLQINRGVTDD